MNTIELCGLSGTTSFGLLFKEFGETGVLLGKAGAEGLDGLLRPVAILQLLRDLTQRRLEVLADARRRGHLQLENLHLLAELVDLGSPVWGARDLGDGFFEADGPVRTGLGRSNVGHHLLPSAVADSVASLRPVRQLAFHLFVGELQLAQQPIPERVVLGPTAHDEPANLGVLAIDVLLDPRSSRLRQLRLLQLLFELPDLALVLPLELREGRGPLCVIRETRELDLEVVLGLLDADHALLSLGCLRLCVLHLILQASDVDFSSLPRPSFVLEFHESSGSLSLLITGFLLLSAERELFTRLLPGEVFGLRRQTSLRLLQGADVGSLLLELDLGLSELAIGHALRFLQNMDVLDDGLVLLGLELLDFPFGLLEISQHFVHVALELVVDVFEPVRLRLVLGRGLLKLRAFRGLGLELLLECFDLAVERALVTLKLKRSVLEVGIARLRAGKMAFQAL